MADRAGDEVCSSERVRDRFLMLESLMPIGGPQVGFGAERKEIHLNMRR